MLLLFKQTIDPNFPKWQLDASRIGSNPGLGYRPRPPDGKIDSTLINFKQGGQPGGDWEHWVKNLNEFLKCKLPLYSHLFYFIIYFYRIT